ncbi:hypothetical protein LTR36_010516 [Oleoguttula mirabilis]|uniref:Uncharacterized protein n=1 Tax=Oleoguttula mirabilis TaxID=1507867 RepID=A0AAV9J4N2_9PEZI|nr:hypothetical protein LTR36_010516 [Oleoguttula mirabilis]
MDTFNDLDTLLFHGDLRRRVNVKWESLRAIGLVSRGYNPDEILAFKLLPASWFVPRVRTRLNADLDWACMPKKVVIGAPGHETLHAYYYIHCGVAGYRDVVNGPGMDNAHGFFFTLVAETIEVETGLNLFAGIESPNR